MGAAHASHITFIPCLTGSFNYDDLPPQAYEYQGALLQDASDILKLASDLVYCLVNRFKKWQPPTLFGFC